MTQWKSRFGMHYNAFPLRSFPRVCHHTEAPGTFFVFYVAPKADGLDKVTEALTVLQSDSIQLGAFYAATDTSAHRDGLTMGNSEFK
jgi:hypothetical protein